MPFKMPEGIENITLSRAGTGQVKLNIWDSTIKQILADIDVSIAEAKGRFLGEGAGAASASNPVTAVAREGEEGKKIYDRPFAAPCWTPQTVPVDKDDLSKGYTPRLNPVTGEELVVVKIKVKSRIVDGLLADMGDNAQTVMQVNATDLIPYLENLRDWIKDMDKSSEDGIKIHDLAVFMAISPKQRKIQTHKMEKKKRVEIPEAERVAVMGDDGIPLNVAHCAKEDRWVAKNLVQEKSPYPTQRYKVEE